MVDPSPQSVRQPAVAGRFYPGDPRECRAAVERMMRGNALGAPAKLVGGIVPHAGWVCSGAIAGQTIATIAQTTPADVVVVFGAVHTPVNIDRAALDSHARWHVPGGDSMQPEDLVRKLSTDQGSFIIEPRLHDREHAVEVELPFIQAAWPDAKLLPIEVPLIESAQQIGIETAQQVLSENQRVVFLASSDLTHYGPAYRFAPAGVGEQALAWAKDNDWRLLALIEDFAIGRIVPEVRTHLNACGGGAIAAMLAACKVAGADRVKVLTHANSYETLRGIVPPDASNAVGYAGVVVGNA